MPEVLPYVKIILACRRPSPTSMGRTPRLRGRAGRPPSRPGSGDRCRQGLLPAGAGLLNAVVVIGAGLAGVRAAAELRAQGYEGRLTLLGAEEGPPYDRPPLSKRVLLA